MKENQLEITTTEKNGKTYKNINLEKLNDGDSVTVIKKDDAVKREARKGTQWDPEKAWTMCRTFVEYNGTEVGFFLPKGYAAQGEGDSLKAVYVDNVAYSDAFDKVGKVGDKVKISVVEGLAKNNKDKKIAVRNYSFTKVD